MRVSQLSIYIYRNQWKKIDKKEKEINKKEREKVWQMV